MATPQIITTDDLTNRIQACESEQFTGRWDLNTGDTQGQQWSLYFYQGGLIWGTSSVHPIRRWYRYLSRHCPELVADREAKRKLQASAINQGANRFGCWDYNALIKLVKHRQIQQEPMTAIIEDNILEILFDILQWGEHLRHRLGGQLTYQQVSQDTIDSRLVVIEADQAWRHAMKFWEAWRRADLADISPNQAPVILKAEELQRQTSPFVYLNLTTLADGNQTFRDLAVKLNRSLLLLTQPIMPFIRKRLMGLNAVGDYSDFARPITTTNPRQGEKTREEFSSKLWNKPITQVPSYPLTPELRPPTASSPQPTAPLVACIDDSRSDSQTMSQILTEAGYRCINVQDPVKALPILLEHKPDLIFLDLVMPIANGYEICTQIRRVSLFQTTPVIILTSNDGIVDRVRAKMVGSSGFLAKPIEREKVMTIVERYLEPPKPVQPQKHETEWAWFPEHRVSAQSNQQLLP